MESIKKRNYRLIGYFTKFNIFADITKIYYYGLAEIFIRNHFQFKWQKI